MVSCCTREAKAHSAARLAVCSINNYAPPEESLRTCALLPSWAVQRAGLRSAPVPLQCTVGSGRGTPLFLVVVGGETRPLGSQSRVLELAACNVAGPSAPDPAALPLTVTLTLTLT